jgi:TolB-like protein
MARITLCTLVYLFCMAPGTIHGNAFARPAQQPVTIGVLPFENLSGDTSKTWIGTGLAVSLSGKLAGIENFAVVERMKLDQLLKEIALGQSGALDDSRAVEAGKIWGTGYVITGSFQIVKRVLKISARIIDVETGQVLKGFEVADRLRKLFMLQNELVVKAIEALGIETDEATRTRLQANNTESVEAFEWYARSLGQPLDAQRECLKKALRYDTKFSYAIQDLDLLAGRMETYDRNRDQYERAVEDSLWEEIVKQGQFSGTAAIQFLGLLLSKGNNKRLLSDCETLLVMSKKNHYLLPYIDMIAYHKVMAYYNMKEWDRFFAEGEKFLTVFPRSNLFPTVNILIKTTADLRLQGIEP